MTTTMCKPLKRADMDPKWLEVQPLIKDSLSELKGLLHGVYDFLPTSDVLSWCKKRESAAEKMIRKGRQSYTEINDLVKGVVLVDSLDEAIAVANFIRANTSVVKLEPKVGTEGKPYCGSIHLDVQLGALVCEIQVMPRATWKVKRVTNASYKQGTAAQDVEVWSSVENFTEGQLAQLKA